MRFKGKFSGDENSCMHCAWLVKEIKLIYQNQTRENPRF